MVDFDTNLVSQDFDKNLTRIWCIFRQGHKTIFYAGGATGSDIEIYIQEGTKKLVVLHNRRNGITVSSNIYDGPLTKDNQWVHLAVTFDGVNITLYYDGVSQGSVAVDAPQVSVDAEEMKPNP